jgi:hypothetical protein
MAGRFEERKVFGRLVETKIRRYISDGSAVRYRTFMGLVEGVIDETTSSGRADEMMAYLEPMMDELEDLYNAIPKPEAKVATPDDICSFGHVSMMNRSFRDSRERGEKKPGSGWVRTW